MIKTITSSATGGLVHVFTNEPGLGNPETVNIITEVYTPVELNAEEAQEFATALSDVINATQE